MKTLIAGILALCLSSAAAMAQTCGSVPFVFSNGTTADATQVNADFAKLLACANAAAPLASPALTGVPTAPTAAPGTNTTQIATTAFALTAQSSANPSATAGPVAINGSATTLMRSDGAPAVQIGSGSQLGLFEVDSSTITSFGGVLSVPVITVAGSGCLPGHSCTIGASQLTNGVTGSGAVVLAASGALAGPALTNPTILGITSGSALGATLCINTGNGVIGSETGSCVPSAMRLKNLEGIVTPEEAKHGLDSLKAVTGRWKNPEQYDAKEHVWLLADDVAKMDPRCGLWKGDLIQTYDERCVIAYLVEDRKALWAALRRRD